MGKRIIKNISNEIISGDSLLDPNKLSYFYNDHENNVCLTKFYLKNNLIKNSSQQCSDKSINEIIKLLSIPSLIIHYDTILEVYNIKSINDLISFIDESIKDNLTFTFINRVINSWIRQNFDDLKQFNKILIKINYIIFNFFFKILIISKEKFYKDTSKFISYWIENNNINNFNLNLIEELKKYLDKKYEQK